MTTATATNQNDSVHAFVDKAADKIHKIINDAGSEVEETKDALSQRLQINPVASLIIALGAGIVLDRVVRGKPAQPVKASQSWHPDILLGLTAMGQTAINQFMYRRLFADTAKIAALIVFGALLAGIGAIGGFYALYLTLLGHGLSAQAATLSVGAGAVVLAAIIAALTVRSIRRLHRTALLAPAALNARRMIQSLAKEFQHILD